VNLESVDFALNELPGDELHRVLASFREHAPVAETRFLGLRSWIITGHEALEAAFKDTERFPPHLMYRASFEPAIGRSFISMDDPEHHAYRKLATPAFRSRAIEDWGREGLAELANELVDEFSGEREVELLGAFVARFPYLVITRLLGLPREREGEFHAWALGLLRFRDDPEAARRAAAELTAYLAPIVKARRREPQDDVISALVAAEFEGRALNDEEIFAHVRLLFPTGGETTQGTLGNLLHAVLTQEGIWQQLIEEPERIPGAVEEILRWDTSIAVLPRMSCDQPIEFYGAEIPANSWVLFAMAAANRDPSVYDDPDHFDIDRRPRDLLTFGKGIKSCPGAHLARKNLLVALQVLTQRLPRLRLLDPDAARPRRAVLRCPDVLRVAID
jgi:cytochrome P450